MAVDIYDVYYDFGDGPNPLERLRQRLQVLGKLLSLLCCLWIAVVGTVLVSDLQPDDLKHHRAPIIQERVKNCTGEFAQRFACADTILLKGQNSGATALLARLGVTFLLPAIALTMWRGVMIRAERLR